MAYLSGQLGAAAARATPAALMQEQVLRNNGGSANVAADEVAPANDGTQAAAGHGRSLLAAPRRRARAMLRRSSRSPRASPKARASIRI